MVASKEHVNTQCSHSTLSLAPGDARPQLTDDALGVAVVGGLHDGWRLVRVGSFDWPVSASHARRLLANAQELATDVEVVYAAAVASAPSPSLGVGPVPTLFADPPRPCVGASPSRRAHTQPPPASSLPRPPESPMVELDAIAQLRMSRVLKRRQAAGKPARPLSIDLNRGASETMRRRRAGMAPHYMVGLPKHGEVAPVAASTSDTIALVPPEDLRWGFSCSSDGDAEALSDLATEMESSPGRVPNDATLGALVCPPLRVTAPPPKAATCVSSNNEPRSLGVDNAIVQAFDAWVTLDACAGDYAPGRTASRRLITSPLDDVARRHRTEISSSRDCSDSVALDSFLSAQSVWRRAASGDDFECFVATFPLDVLPEPPQPALTPLTISELLASPTCRRAIGHGDVGELCAGIGTLSGEFRHGGARPRVLVELDGCDRAFLNAQFPDASTYGDFFDYAWRSSKATSLLAVYGGISCVFVSDAGLGLGARDSRAPISTAALPMMAVHFRSPFIDFENVLGIATADGGSVLTQLDANAAAANFVRTPRISGSDGGLEVVRPNLNGGVGVRDRAIGHYELDGLERLIGPCPTLSIDAITPLTIADILDVGPRAPELMVTGLFQPVAQPDLSNTRFPITAGWITIGGAGLPLAVGSRVSARRLEPGEWVVFELTHDAAFVFLDDRRNRRWRWVPLEAADRRGPDPLVHCSRRFRVLDVRGTAATSTEFGVPPVGCAKQFWFVNGSVVSPSAAELWRLQEYDTSQMATYVAAASPQLQGDVQSQLSLKLRQLPGKGLNARVAAAVARRTLTRAALLAAVIDGAVAHFGDSLEHRLARDMRAYAPVAGLILTVIIAVAWINQRPHVLVDGCGDRLPTLTDDANAQRKSAIVNAERLMAEACPERRPRALLVADLKWARLVAVPLAFHAPAQLHFGDAQWRPLASLAGRRVASPCARAVAVVAAMMSRSNVAAMPPPVIPGGARQAAFVPQASPVLTVDATRWQQQVTDAGDACDALRGALLSVAESDDADAGWFAGWHDQVSSFDATEVPASLRGHKPDFDDASFASTPFAYRDAIPTTLPAPVPPPQATEYQPRSFCPDIFSPALEARWAAWWPKVVADLRNYAALGEGAERSFNEPFVAARSELHPSAVGTVWDTRRHTPGGYYAPVDFTARLRQNVRPDGGCDVDDPSAINTHLGVRFLQSEWTDLADQEMVAMITRTGVDFKIDATARQLAVFPHLVSLPRGFSSVERELRRLNGLGFNEFCANFPFVPFSGLPQGSVKRKLEDRDRRTTEGYAPRNPRYDRDGEPVVPLNAAIGAKDRVEAPSWRLPGLATTTGHVTYDAALEAHASADRKQHPPTRWPPEVKVRNEDQLHNMAVLGHAGSVLGQPVFVLTADAKDFFNQLRLAAWAIHHVGLLWLPLDMTHESFSFVAEHTLGFGITMASNIAQRFANGLIDIFLRAFDEADAPFLDADADTPARRAWLAKRRALSLRTGRNEARLVSALMYTDDPSFTVVGTERTVRMLRVWRWVTWHANLTMAIAAKHTIGAKSSWLGLSHISALGITVVPTAKLLRTLRALDDLTSNVEVPVREYESLLGMLEHLLVWANGQRSAMFGLYGPLKRARVLGPSTPVRLTDMARRSLLDWAERLRGRSGVPATAVFQRSRFDLSAPSGTEMVIFTDAAKDGTATPGLGGYAHGLRWRVPLERADVVGEHEIPIAVLEFVGIVVAILTFARILDAAAAVVTVASDSLTSVDAVLNDSSHADLMQLVHDFLLRSDEYQLIRPKLRLAHVYGEGNAWADAESRGHSDVIAALSAQLGVEPVSPRVPEHALTLLTLVRGAVRGLTPNELGVDAANSGCATGDGPSFSHLALSASIPGVPDQRAPEHAPRVSAPSAAVSAALSRPPGAPSPNNALDRFAHLAAPRSLPAALQSSATQAVVAGATLAAADRLGAMTRAAPTADPVIAAPARSAEAKRVRLASTSTRASALFSSLMSDKSQHALRPVDTAAFAAFVDDIGELIEEATPLNTLIKDATAWRRWEALCASFGTPAWRPSAETLSHDEVRRERFLFSAYTVKEYRVNIKPKRGAPNPKPTSAMNNALAVKRVLKRGGVSTVATPELTVILKGMLRQYIRLHGPESLLPKRAEPLTNADTEAILRLGRDGPVTINGRTLNWEQPFWRSFRAFLTTARAAAFRKADVLPATVADFDMGSASRANLSWYFRGAYRVSLTPAELSTLTIGDRAVLRPPPVKNDPYSESFGNHPIWLPFDPDDELNAARWLADLELAHPVSDDERRSVPLFPSHTARAPLTHGPADRAFRALADAALGPARSAQLTLHSMRVFAACSLLAQGASRPLIQALCRWKCDASVDIYARLRPEDYVHWVRRMRTADVTSLTVRNLPELDADALARAVDAIA